ncbi:hypothetical protein [Jannaschia sp. W003]|uniref:hypothetical protein n=1 Tax=Jannaschia sp. W003 TaxID=2867012 RepID=UPI0021A89EAA|nr:hypothetical protein [Jannaschia sp. W003]UWQ20436.1 hypothetical protein K3554_10580 [Jannaschia sp. W003]
MRVISAIAAALALGACASGGPGGGGIGSNIGWLGGDRSVPIAAGAPRANLAAEIVGLDAAPTPGGLIVSAIALPPTQGYYDARLVRLPSPDASTYLMEFQLSGPPGPRPAGTPASREVLGGTFLTPGDLQGITQIAVQGTANRRVIRRQ